MIDILLDGKTQPFIQDIRELTQAFFPGEQLSFEETEAPALRLSLRDSARIMSGERRRDKNQLKVALYRQLSAYTGRELPWGSLTGIRPVKLASELLESFDEDVAAAILQRDYAVSPQKRALMLDIARREKGLLARLSRESGTPYQEGWSLYVGIPFCPTRCLYCSFTAHPIAQWQGELERYLDCLEREFAHTAECMRGRSLQTLYVGGGTPTSLPEPQLARLMSLLQRYFGAAQLPEFTVEAGRPDSITEEKLRILKAAGVGRISINPQSFNQKTLDLIGRRHTVEAAVETYELARRLGFDNINMDIILGLPGERMAELERTLAWIRRLKPDNLTVHSLAVKRAARLKTEGERWSGVYRAGEDAAEITAMMTAAEDCAAQLALKPYYLYRQKNMAGNLENTGYAAEGKACLYNIMMMEEKHSVLGCGAGCTSKLVLPGRSRVERSENVKSIQDYLARSEELLQKKIEFTKILQN